MSKPLSSEALIAELHAFNQFGKPTVHFIHTFPTTHGNMQVPFFVKEFWTAKQRAANRLHEISYRACFKPQLPRFFITRLTNPGEVVLDPFMGRATTLIEAALLGRVPFGCDINPLSILLGRPRLRPPTLRQVAQRLNEIDLGDAGELPGALLVFYHPETLKEVCALRKYLIRRQASLELDALDEWIWMVALNRLTGHSSGFFSVYTLPPNQAVPLERQIKLNEENKRSPDRRHVPDLILRKTRHLLKGCDDEVRRILAGVISKACLLTGPAAAMPKIAAGSVSLVVTSPPFLDVVDYAGDNWLRSWFAGIDPASVRVTAARKVEEWQKVMTEVFRELSRVLRPGGHIAFEVGEVRNRTVKLEDAVLPCGLSAGLIPTLVLINDQKFTKTSHCWGQENNRKGTNTNRIVLFRKAS
jgi:DNA modification methylase